MFKKLRFLAHKVKKSILTLKDRRTKAHKNIRMKYLFEENCVIQLPDIDNSYQQYSYSPDIMEKWIELLNSNNEFGYWDKERFTEEMLKKLILGTEILLVSNNRLIGSCASFSLKEYEPYPVLAYPYVLPEFRNQGLGTFLIKKTLIECQRRGYPGVILNTQDYRVSALHVYQKIGFKIGT